MSFFGSLNTTFISINTIAATAFHCQSVREDEYMHEYAHAHAVIIRSSSKAHLLAELYGDLASALLLNDDHKN